MRSWWWSTRTSGGGPRRYWPRLGAVLLGLRLGGVVLAMPVLLRLPLPRLARFLEPPGGPAASSPARIDTIVRTVDVLLWGRRWRRRGGCLTRGLTLYYGLRRAGLEVALCFGLGHVQGMYVGHCWLVKEGAPFMEARDPRLLFTEMYRFPVPRRAVAVAPPPVAPAPTPRTPPRVTQGYRLHGLGVAVAGAPEVAAALHTRLRRLPPQEPSPADLTFTLDEVPAGGAHLVTRPPGAARPLADPPDGEVLYVAGMDQLYLAEADGVRIRCAPAEGRVWASVRQPVGDHLWRLSHHLFTLPLVELLKRRGLYSVHAAGLGLHGRGLLLAGASGAGKSTLTLALVRAGWGWLGDDVLFLRPGAAGLRVLAFPEAITVTEATAAMFPELHPLLLQPTALQGPKRPVEADDVYGVACLWECRPGVVVFPRVAQTATSVLRPMDRGEALLALAPNVLPTDAHASQAHLDALAALVTASACYRLETGRDVETLPARFRALLE
jgi:hypothetical protein